MVLYRTKLPSSWAATNATLQLGAPVHDYAKVWATRLGYLSTLEGSTWMPHMLC